MVKLLCASIPTIHEMSLTLKCSENHVDSVTRYIYIICRLGHSCRPRAAFSRPRSQFFTIRTSQPANNLFIFFQALKRKKFTKRKLAQALLWPWSEIAKSAKNQSDCRIRYRARLEKNKYFSVPFRIMNFEDLCRIDFIVLANIFFIPIN